MEARARELEATAHEAVQGMQAAQRECGWLHEQLRTCMPDEQARTPRTCGVLTPPGGVGVGGVSGVGVGVVGVGGTVGVANVVIVVFSAI